MSYTIASFYRFVSLENLEKLKTIILSECNNLNLMGTILIADEGINGTICGNQDEIESFYEFFETFDEFQGTQLKKTFCEKIPFQKMKVKIRDEIIKINDKKLNIDASENYVEAEKWNELIEDESTILIDTRNYYETKIGRFKNAIDPKTENFHEFPNWFDEFLKKNDLQGKKIAMYCTMGIRCEKTVSYIKKHGIDEVYHLKDGIVAYLAQKKDKHMWEGECFVFDDRVAVDENLNPSKKIICHSCNEYVEDIGDFVNITKGKVLCKVCNLS